MRFSWFESLTPDPRIHLHPDWHIPASQTGDDNLADKQSEAAFNKFWGQKPDQIDIELRSTTVMKGLGHLGVTDNEAGVPVVPFVGYSGEEMGQHALKLLNSSDSYDLEDYELEQGQDVDTTAKQTESFYGDWETPFDIGQIHHTAAHHPDPFV